MSGSGTSPGKRPPSASPGRERKGWSARSRPGTRTRSSRAASSRPRPAQGGAIAAPLDLLPGVWAVFGPTDGDRRALREGARARRAARARADRDRGVGDPEGRGGDPGGRARADRGVESLGGAPRRLALPLEGMLHGAGGHRAPPDLRQGPAQARRPAARRRFAAPAAAAGLRSGRGRGGARDRHAHERRRFSGARGDDRPGVREDRERAARDAGGDRREPDPRHGRVPAASSTDRLSAGPALVLRGGSRLRLRRGRLLILLLRFAGAGAE